MLIDSDVLVWLTRGHVGAAQRLQAIEAWRISTVTYIELAQGSRDKADLARLKKGLAARNTEIVPLTPAISTLSVLRTSRNCSGSKALVESPAKLGSALT